MERVKHPLTVPTPSDIPPDVSGAGVWDKNVGD
jgi:hypothetical protein